MLLLFLITFVFAQEPEAGTPQEPKLPPCSDGEYVSPSGYCEPCTASLNCKTCFSANKCSSCDETKEYFMDTDYSCKLRPKDNFKVTEEEGNEKQLCATWDALFCTSCVEGYYLSNQECKPCKSNCLYCNAQQCFKCADNYALVKNGAECVDCSTPGTNDEACGRCGLGQYFNVDSQSCTNCRENCTRCSNGQNCFMCKDGYALENPQDYTSACIQIANCASGHTYGDHCELCDSGFFLSEGKCEACPTNCHKCIDGETCVECIQGKYLFNGECVDSIYKCRRANNIQGCLECEDGYYLTEGSVCQECPKECATCLNEGYCFRCSEKYYFNPDQEGNCIEKDIRCKATDQYGCLECLFDIVDDAIVREVKAEFPDRTDAFENFTYGFFIKTELIDDKVSYERKCTRCDPECKICQYNSSWCSACNEGYALKINDEATAAHFELTGVQQDIYECAPKPDSCRKTEMGYCVECEDEYFLKDVECLKCDDSCASCTNSTFCQTCLDGSGENSTENALYWKPPSYLKKENKGGLCLRVNESYGGDYNLDKCMVRVTTSGCAQCLAGYYSEDGYCHPCPDRCSECTVDLDGHNKDGVMCTKCHEPGEFLSSDGYGTCLPCSDIENCAECRGTGCDVCMEGYSLSSNKMLCEKVNLALVLPLSIGGCLILIAIILIIIFLLWRRKRKQEKEREAEIRPFKVSSDIELALLSADNENFPLKTDTWELNFGLQTTKAVVDEEYEQKMTVMNNSEKSYYFEILSNPSHKYILDISPLRQTLRPGFAIEITFKIKMLCTAVVYDDIGIVAMDVEDNNKETAKLKVIIESDLSTKIDHTELKPNMPPIGEGAFGIVFRGTYRGQDVAIKKMKARNLTEEQEKEFNHEVTMLNQLRHQCVVSLIGAVYTEGEISIITEFAEYGSMSKMWGKHHISYELKVKLLDDMVVALSFLHQNTIIHRDIKGENILVYSLNPHSSVCGKLTDFGTCRNISERSLANKELSTGIGTPTYMSPESLQNSTTYGYPVDIYAFGVVLYETFMEKTAYDNDERFNQPWMIPQFVIEGNRLERPDEMSDEYWDLVDKCWAQSADDRPTATEILAEFASWGLDYTHVGGDQGTVIKKEEPKEEEEEQQEEEAAEEEEVPAEQEEEQEEETTSSSSSSSTSEE